MYPVLEEQLYLGNCNRIVKKGLFVIFTNKKAITKF